MQCCGGENASYRKISSLQRAHPVACCREPIAFDVVNFAHRHQRQFKTFQHAAVLATAGIAAAGVAWRGAGPLGHSR